MSTAVSGDLIMGAVRVEQGSKHMALRSSDVDGHRGAAGVANSYSLRFTDEDVEDPIA